MKKVGVLALQGDFEAHGRALTRVGAFPVYVRSAADLEPVDGLVIPGGESTAMLKLIRGQKLWEPLQRFGEERPVFGTCAGVILMAQEVTHPEQESLGLMDVAVERNGYGRQIDSRVRQIYSEAICGKQIRSTRDCGTGNGTAEKPMEAVFIRAPIIRRVGSGVRVLAEYEGSPVLVEEKCHMGSTFHPELTNDGQVHELFLRKL